MKYTKILLITILWMLSHDAIARDVISLDELIDAVILVESGGDERAFNRKENAIGILQIRPIMVRDFNRITGSSLKHSDMWCPEISRMVAKKVLIHYGRIIERKEGAATFAHLAAVWNGGFNAYKRIYYDENLQRYISRVEENLFNG